MVCENQRSVVGFHYTYITLDHLLLNFIEVENAVIELTGNFTLTKATPSLKEVIKI